jgi:hypothetical protein
MGRLSSGNRILPWRSMLLGLASWAISRSTLFLGLEDWFQDACFTYHHALFGKRPTTLKVNIIGIDDA